MEWYKFVICFGLLVVLPVWIFNFVPLGIFLKIAFTIAGGAGIYMALEFGTLRQRK